MSVLVSPPQRWPIQKNKMSQWHCNTFEAKIKSKRKRTPCGVKCKAQCRHHWYTLWWETSLYFFFYHQRGVLVMALHAPAWGDAQVPYTSLHPTFSNLGCSGQCPTSMVARRWMGYQPEGHRRLTALWGNAYSSYISLCRASNIPPQCSDQKWHTYYKYWEAERPCHFACHAYSHSNVTQRAAASGNGHWLPSLKGTG